MTDFRVIQQKPIEDLKHVNLKLALSRRIRDDRGIVGAHITGKQQTGKTAYALLILYELFEHNEDEVFKHIAFTIQDLTVKLRNAIKTHQRMRCILWDDTSVHGSATQYHINRKLVMKLAAMGDTMGLATKGFLMTSPSGDVTKAFRNYDFYKVKIDFYDDKYLRVAKGYGTNIDVYDKKWHPAEFRDYFDVRIPFYQRYYELREQLSLSTIDDMDKELEEAPKPFNIVQVGKRKYSEIIVDDDEDMPVPDEK